MPVPRETEVPFRENSKQIGASITALSSGSIFKGFQKSKGNSYEVEVVLQVNMFRKYVAQGSNQFPFMLLDIRRNFKILCEVNGNFQLSSQIARFQGKSVNKIVNFVVTLLVDFFLKVFLCWTLALRVMKSILVSLRYCGFFF